MANAQVWRKRVTDWKASGLPAEDFCDGRDFSGSLLRHWAWRLGLTRRRDRRVGPRTEPTMSLARVVVTRPRAPAAAPPGPRPPELELEVGLARVHVRAGFDAGTLSAVLDVLEGRVTRKEKRQ